MPGYEAMILAIAAVLGVVVVVSAAATAVRRRAKRRGEMPAIGGQSRQNVPATPRDVRLMDSVTPKRGPLGWEDNEAAAGSEEERDALEMQEDGVSGREKTVLVADDDPVVLAVLTRRLQRMGFQVMRSPDSSHALFGAMKMLPDLIILDINMPSGNGLAVCEMMACDQRCAHIPVIVHSEIADEAVKRRCERLGAHYVEKSARSWAEIKSLVESLIGEHRAAPPEPKDAVQPSEGAYASHSSMRDSPVLADAKSAGVSASPADRQSPADAAPTSAPTTGRRLVLCIESPKGRLESVEHQLLAVDIEVSRSADPEEGFWTCFTERPFAIVVQIADDKNGLLKLLARIVQHPVTRAIPVLVINENELISAGDLPSAGKIKILEHAVDWEDLLCELEAYCPVLHQDKLIPSPSTRHSAAPAEHKEDKASVAGSQPATGESSQEPIVLLCIDDDPVVAKSIAKRLQPYPINLKWANNGTQGYMMAMAEKPDLIILDLKMPNGEGNYVLVKLKENPHTQNIPVIVLTIEKHLGVRRQMFSIGADAYLNKPIDWAVLFGEMSRCVHLPTQLLQDYRLKDQLSLAEL